MATMVRAGAVARSLPRAASRRRRRLNPNYLFLLPATAFVLLMAVYPLAFNVSMSFRDVDAGALIRGDAEFVGIDNYRKVFGGTAIWQAAGVSAVYTAVSVILILVVGFLLAMLFRKRFPGSGTIRALLLLAWILPSVVSGNIFRWMLDGDAGIVNFVLRTLGYPENIYWLTNESTAIVGVILATVWSGAPFAMILIIAGLLAIPDSVYESAAVAGASAWQTTRYITIPMLRPVLLTAAILSLIYTFKTFDTIYIMTKGGPGGSTAVLPIFAYQQAFQFFRFGEGAVATTLLLVIPLVMATVYFILSRRDQEATA